MNTYPLELRRRVVKAVDNKIGTKTEIAATFSVSTSWIRKLLQRRSKTGSIDPSPRTQGRKQAFRGKQLNELDNFIKSHPDATLEEIKRHFSGKVNCSIVTIHNNLQRLGWHYKKNRYVPANKTEKM
jgi:transposase